MNEKESERERWEEEQEIIMKFYEFLGLEKEEWINAFWRLL